MIKRYYLMDFSVDEKITGKDYPQCWDFVKGTNLEAPHSFYATSDAWEKDEIPKFTPELDGYKLSNKCRMTDFMSTSILHFPLVSQRAKEILSSFNLGRHEFYPAKILAKGKERLFYFLYTPSIINNEVNLAKSRFCMCDCHTYKPTKMFVSGIHNITEYRQLYNDMIFKDLENRLQIFEIAVKKDFDTDYFMLWPLITSKQFLISEKLFNSIEENKLTGFEVTRVIYANCIE